MDLYEKVGEEPVAAAVPAAAAAAAESSNLVQPISLELVCHPFKRWAGGRIRGPALLQQCHICVESRKGRGAWA